MINGAFPRYSVSTNTITKQQDYHYRYSLDDTRTSTPQRVHRKPVPRPSPATTETNLRTADSINVRKKKKEYSAADTVHPNRIRTSNQVKPSKQPPPVSMQPPTRQQPLQPQAQSLHKKHQQEPQQKPLSSSVTAPLITPKPQPHHPLKLRPSTTTPTINLMEQQQQQQQQQQQNIIVRTRKLSQASSITPNFWYPRSDKDIAEPVKQALTKKLKGLLQPHRIQIEGASKDLNQDEIDASIARPKTPTQKITDNPFKALSQTWNVSEKTGLSFHEDDFNQVDTYASTVQQRGPLLTPMLLSQKFLVRPYHRNDLFKLRVLFTWLIQNIRPDYDQTRKHDFYVLKKRQQQLQQQQMQHHPLVEPSKSSNLRQKLGLVSEPNIPDILHQQQLLMEQQKLDAMDLLQEESNIMTAVMEEREDAAEVLESRSCKSAVGMANLFYEMAVAAGIQDCRVVYGYLKAPKDTNNEDKQHHPLEPNHAWCSVKIEGEYRFIDCWLASPFHPQNDNKFEPHWFLTIPQDMILTHYPQQELQQYLNPTISRDQFFSLPYVRNPFFWHQLKVFKMNLVYEKQDGIFYVTLRLDNDVSCYAETESDSSHRLIKRGLAQCLTDSRDHRVCKVKAVLAPGETHGWLKIYAGPRATPTQQQYNEQVIDKHHYALALCLRVSTTHTPNSVEELATTTKSITTTEKTPFSFVQLYVAHNEFYIQEPQCQFLYPLQSYRFCVRNSTYSYKAAHHKLAVKSPGGKLYKLMYCPQDQTYDVNVKVAEAGKWTLICLLHHTGGWYSVASWTCIIK